MYRHSHTSLLRIMVMLIFCMVSSRAFGHNIVLTMDNMSQTDTALFYLKLGYKHILPLGLDHILFVLSLFLLTSNIRQVLWQSLAFTIAHSVTLGLAMYGLIKAPSSFVEPLIALSIAFVALENIITDKLKATRIFIVFGFGLVHGLGFASALYGLGLPEHAFLSSLVLFNAGVELGQLTVILAAYLLVGKWFAKKPGYRKFVVIPASLLIAMIACTWFLQRL